MRVPALSPSAILLLPVDKRCNAFLPIPTLELPVNVVVPMAVNPIAILKLPLRIPLPAALPINTLLLPERKLKPALEPTAVLASPLPSLPVPNTPNALFPTATLNCCFTCPSA